MYTQNINIPTKDLLLLLCQHHNKLSLQSLPSVNDIPMNIDTITKSYILMRNKQNHKEKQNANVKIKAIIQL